MALTRQEILDFAARYVAPEAVTDFPHDGDLFCLLSRERPEGKVLTEEEGWSFQGYGICAGYILDEESVPRGKWLWMHFASLATFPPSAQVLKLQPPHVVKGRFQNPDRTLEFRILKVSLRAGAEKEAAEKPEIGETVPTAEVAPTGEAAPTREKKPEEKIVRFRKRGDSAPRRA